MQQPDLDVPTAAAQAAHGGHRGARGAERVDRDPRPTPGDLVDRGRWICVPAGVHDRLGAHSDRHTPVAPTARTAPASGQTGSGTSCTVGVAP
jgi:hypothetical protein